MLIALAGITSMIRACADDLILLLYTVRALLAVQRTFELAMKAASLVLHARKSVLVPLYALCTMHIVEQMRVSVATWCPMLAGSEIASSATFLGLPFGPGAQLSDVWRAPS